MPVLELRRAKEADLSQVLELMAASLGWDSQHPHAELFRWKHIDNAFGPSPSWVAVDGDRIVGFRTFMRWEFLRDGQVLRAVRAVDTATHPEFQGRGIFRSLTLMGLEALAGQADLVFNTPNDQSRPGYLKMGWEPVGALAVRARLRTPLSVLAMARARVPAELWSEDLQAGMPVSALLARAGLMHLQPPTGAGQLTTHRSSEFLGWRYGWEPLHYRALSSPDGGSAIIFRVRRRGAARELVMAEILADRGSPWVRRLCSQALRETKADYALALGRMPRSLPVPGQGPLLVRRDISAPIAPRELAAWQLTLGDVELF